VLALAWGLALLIAPHGLGHLMLGNLWRPIYPLVLPTMFSVMAMCAGTGANVGLARSARQLCYQRPRIQLAGKFSGSQTGGQTLVALPSDQCRVTRTRAAGPAGVSGAADCSPCPVAPAPPAR
jgi:hypothetical protein